MILFVLLWVCGIVVSLYICSRIEPVITLFDIIGSLILWWLFPLILFCSFLRDNSGMVVWRRK